MKLSQRLSQGLSNARSRAKSWSSNMYNKYKSKRRTGGKKKTSKKNKRKSSKKRKSTKCKSGYVKSRKTGRCVFATGRRGRSLNKKRGAKTLSHKRSGRPSPNVSAKNYSSGYEKVGHDGNMWKIKVTSSGTHRWVRAK